MAMSPELLETMQAIFQEIAKNPNHIYPKLTPGEPRKRYITTITRTSAGYLEISGDAGTRSYMGYSQREAEALYNREARKRRSA